MSLSLVEAAKLSNDVLMRGVIETTVYESETLQRLPFVEIEGNALTYNRENVAAQAQFYSPGDTWTEGTTTFTQATANLTILGGDADIDTFIRQTRGNIQDQQAVQIAFKARALAHKFDDTFLNGDTDVDPKSFNGLKDLIGTSGDQYIIMGAAGAALSLAKLDELMDAVKPGKPQCLIMSKASRRAVKALARAANSGIVETSLNAFGQMVNSYDGVPISINEWQSDTETLGASGAVCSSIYAVKFGEAGLAGLCNGWIVTEEIGRLETKDAERFRLKWYCGLALFNTLSAARLAGIIV